MNLPEGQSTKEDIAKIMEQMNRMSEQIKLLTSFGFGPPRGGQEDDKLSERALASSEGEEQREELEELNSQHPKPCILSFPRSIQGKFQGMTWDPVSFSCCQVYEH